MRVGTRTDVGRRWSPAGVRPLGRRHIGYEYVYLYVSLRPFVGKVFARFLPRLDKECFAVFARERSLKVERKTLLILDGAGAHRLAEQNALLELSRLPVYSPELTPVERFFQELQRKLKFRVFDTPDDAEKYVTEALLEFFDDAERVKSLTLYPYIKDVRNNLN